jgi:hypothetical protein
MLLRVMQALRQIPPTKTFPVWIVEVDGKWERILVFGMWSGGILDR